MENNTPTANQTIPADILSTFTGWCKSADRSEADVHQEISEIHTNVMQLTDANREQLMEIWRTVGSQVRVQIFEQGNGKPYFVSQVAECDVLVELRAHDIEDNYKLTDLRYRLTDVGGAPSEGVIGDVFDIPRYRYELLDFDADTMSAPLIECHATRHSRTAGCLFAITATTCECDTSSDGCEENPFDDNGWPLPPAGLIAEARLALRKAR